VKFTLSTNWISWWGSSFSVLLEFIFMYDYYYLTVFRRIAGFRKVSGSHPKYLEYKLRCGQWEDRGLPSGCLCVVLARLIILLLHVSSQKASRVEGGCRVRPCACVVQPQHPDSVECMCLPTGHNPTVSQALGVLAKINMQKKNLDLSFKTFFKTLNVSSIF
jgi:hypothetical protein